MRQEDYFVYPPKTDARMRREDISRLGTPEVHLALLDENVGDIMEGKSEINKPLAVFDDDLITNEALQLNEPKVIINCS